MHNISPKHIDTELNSFIKLSHIYVISIRNVWKTFTSVSSVLRFSVISLGILRISGNFCGINKKTKIWFYDIVRFTRYLLGWATSVTYYLSTSIKQGIHEYTQDCQKHHLVAVTKQLCLICIFLLLILYHNGSYSCK